MAQKLQYFAKNSIICLSFKNQTKVDSKNYSLPKNKIKNDIKKN